MMLNDKTSYLNIHSLTKHSTALPMSLASSLFTFFRSLPAFNSLSQKNQTFLNTNNLRTLIFPNMFELNQTCYSESWQVKTFSE